MISPDQLPAWFAAPVGFVVWVAFLAPVVRDVVRSRRNR